MLYATRRLFTETLHPLERGAAVDLVSIRGGPADAEALLPVLLADPAVNGDLIDPIARHGDAAMVRRLYDRFVEGGRMVDGADPRLLWAFGWAGLEEARPMLFHYACEPNWDSAPAALDGLVHLPPDGLEAEVRAVVGACVGRPLFAEYAPALAGWIGDAELLDRFLVEDGKTELPSADCLAGVILGVGLLGPAGRQRLHDLFWADHYPIIWGDQPAATGRAMRMTGLGVADLAAELRTRIAASDEAPPFWWFVLVRVMAEHQVATYDAPPAWRFQPSPETPLDLHRALFGPNDGWDEGLAHHARERLEGECDWLLHEIHQLRGPVQDLIWRDQLLAELDSYSGSTTTAVP
ncbi:hypothetical protein [Brevundimonas basaltis]|uniref:Uncharacterized protein n=1 Tax=Brevundimonas basaltis TaxID=472166 RepID=A0A7W8HWN6_9CAUL|nr:hypothetical protein [Brevundimonas basaltis]MBB5291251.1 hypothetical protein [Brevundimonas basaltis]